MKTISHLPLLSLMWLSGGGMLRAQEPSTPAAPSHAVPASTSPFATSSQPVAMAPSDRFPHALRLSAGTLGQILAEVEDHVQAQGLQPGSAPIPENAADAMPNLLYDPDTEKLPVPTSLVLRNVTPLQAVTLVAAAAGCTLEPVTAPAGEGTPRPGEPQVVGYRVVKASRPPATVFSEVFNARLPDPDHIAALRKKLEALQLTLSDKHPALTEVRDELARLEQMKTDVLKMVPPGAGGTIRVVEPLPGGAGSVGIAQLQNGGNFLLERRISADPGSPASASATAEPAAAQTGPSSPASLTTPSAPAVRIYALGALLVGRSEEEVKIAQDDMQRLLASALDQADLDNPGPDLFFHDATKVLVAKGNAAQHEIIGQVLTALKENQLADPPAQKP